MLAGPFTFNFLLQYYTKFDADTTIIITDPSLFPDRKIPGIPAGCRCHDPVYRRQSECASPPQRKRRPVSGRFFHQQLHLHLQPAALRRPLTLACKGRAADRSFSGLLQNAPEHQGVSERASRSDDGAHEFFLCKDLAAAKRLCSNRIQNHRPDFRPGNGISSPGRTGKACRFSSTVQSGKNNAQPTSPVPSRGSFSPYRRTVCRRCW